MSCIKFGKQETIAQETSAGEFSFYICLATAENPVVVQGLLFTI